MPWQRQLPLLVVPLVLAFNLSVESGMDRVPAGLAIGYFVLAALGSLFQLWVGADLTPTELDVHNLRRRHVQWGRIQLIAVEPSFGSRRVAVWLDSGERVPLRAPMIPPWGTGAARFDRDYHTIGQTWLAQRGPDWRPVVASDAGSWPTG